MPYPEDEVLLLLTPQRQLFPMLGQALHLSQNSQKNLQASIGSLIISRQGDVRRITVIKRKGLSGTTLKEKCLSALFGVYTIDATLTPFSMHLAEIKTLIRDYLTYDMHSHAPNLPLPDPQQTLADILQANSIARVFELLQLPDAGDCLDQL